MIAGGLAGSLFFPANQTAKWLLFSIGCVWFVPIISAMLFEWAALAEAQPAVYGTYCLVAYMTVLLWCAYPVMWGLCEGTGVLSDSMEVILYTVLDVLAKVVLGFVLLGSRDAIDAATSAVNAVRPPAALRTRLINEPNA